MATSIKILKQNNIIRVLRQTASKVFVPFTFTATVQGQVEFELPSTPAVILLCCVNGTVQNQEAGDFTLTGKLLYIENGVDIGDKVFGVYQE